MQVGVINDIFGSQEEQIHVYLFQFCLCTMYELAKQNLDYNVLSLGEVNCI
jgi:hypothetical protein